MRPKGTRQSFAARLNAREKKQIVAWSHAAVTQRDIALRLRCDAGTVCKWQRRLGCAVSRRPLDEAAEREIIALAAEGLGYRRIAEITAIGQNKVHRFMQDRGLSQKTGGQFKIPKEKKEAIIQAVKRRENFGAALARKYGVSPSTALRIAHETLGNGRFFTSPNVWPPLQSPFPQENWESLLKTFDTETAGPDQYVELVSRVLKKSFDGHFPFAREHDTHFIAALLVAFQRCVAGFEGQPQPALDLFHANLREAVASMRLAQAVSSSDLVN